MKMIQEIKGDSPEIRVSVVSSNIALRDFYNHPDYYVSEYVGRVDEKYFRAIQKDKIRDKEIEQFMFIHVDFDTIFNFKQVQQLDKEIIILEQEDCFDKRSLEIIRKGINIVLANKDLYLKFEYDV